MAVQFRLSSTTYKRPRRNAKVSLSHIDPLCRGHMRDFSEGKVGVSPISDTERSRFSIIKGSTHGIFQRTTLKNKD